MTNFITLKIKIQIVQFQFTLYMLFSVVNDIRHKLITLEETRLIFVIKIF